LEPQLHSFSHISFFVHLSFKHERSHTDVILQNARVNLTGALNILTNPILSTASSSLTLHTNGLATKTEKEKYFLFSFFRNRFLIFVRQTDNGVFS